MIDFFLFYSLISHCGLYVHSVHCFLSILFHTVKTFTHSSRRIENTGLLPDKENNFVSIFPYSRKVFMNIGIGKDMARTVESSNQKPFDR